MIDHRKLLLMWLKSQDEAFTSSLLTDYHEHSMDSWDLIYALVGHDEFRAAQDEYLAQKEVPNPPATMGECPPSSPSASGS